MANLNVNGIIKSNGGGSDYYPVDLIVEQGSNYIRYNNGLQICFGDASGTGTPTFTFPVPFKDATYKIAIVPESTDDGYVTFRSISAISKTTTDFKRGQQGRDFHTQYIAIGHWK